MISKNQLLIAELLLIAVPLSYHVYTKTGNITTAVLTFGLTTAVIMNFFVSPAKTWDSMALFLNPFVIAITGFTLSLIYLNYTGTAFVSAKWQALGLSLISLVLGFMITRYWHI